LIELICSSDCESIRRTGHATWLFLSNGDGGKPAGIKVIESEAAWQGHATVYCLTLDLNVAFVNGP